MMNKLKYIVFAVILIISGCTKKPNAEVDNETQTVFDFSNNTRDFVAIVSAVHQALIYTPGTGANQNKTGLSACNLLTQVSGDTLWGTVGHVNPTYSMTTQNIRACNSESLIPLDKNNLGQVDITLNDKLQNVGATCIVKVKGQWIKALGDFYNTEAYNLCDSIVIKTVNSDANVATFDISLVGGKLIQDLTGKISKISLNIKLQSFVANVPEPYVSFYGEAKGVNINNLSYTSTIANDSPILKSKNCYYFKSGKAEVEPFGFKKRIINYGSGNCDNNANFAVNENTIAFKLK